jgi:uncharacterized protein YcnI
MSTNTTSSHATSSEPGPASAAGSRSAPATGLRRTAVLLSTAALSLVAAAGVAQAHVTVNPNTATQGSWAKVSFRVPNEEAAASTTSIEIDLPTDHPIASVSVRPVPGWTAATTSSPLATPLKTDDGEVTEAVSKIVWAGGKIDPGQFQEFDVSLGPLPATDQVVFKALQTYSDGTVVRWIDLRQPGQPEPDHPAPILKLSPAGASAGAAASPSAAAANGSPSVALAAAPSHQKSSDGTARALSIAGLGVGLLGFGTAIFALRRKNSPTA